MNRVFKTFLPLLCVTILLAAAAGCAKKVKVVEGKAHVEFKWQPHYKEKSTGWLVAYGYVINRGTKRADWVQVTIYTRDKRTGVVLEKITTYIDGSGPNGRSLEPGESARYEVKLNAKKKYHYYYEREVTWSDPL